MIDRSKGIAYCSLACCLCGENSHCPGCRNEGCQNKYWCKSFNCCKQKSLNGCWECSDFPCDNPMLNKLRVRTFAKCVSEYGEEKFMDLLEKNEKAGIIYHYEGQLIGDYDKPETEEGIKQLILGK